MKMMPISSKEEKAVEDVGGQVATK